MKPLPWRMAGLFLVASALWAGGPGPARAVDQTVAGQALSIGIPTSYCALDRSDPLEDEMYRLIEQVQASLNRVLAVFYDCEELALMRKGERDSFDRYGWVTTPVAELAYPGTPRQVYFDELEKMFEEAFAAGMRQGRAQAVEILPELQVGEIRSLGILERDAAAIYAGALEEAEFESERLTIASVVAMTLIKHVPVSVTLYRPYESQETLDGLLAEQRGFLTALLRRNNALEGRLTPPPQ